MKQFLILSIDFYQKTLSPDHGLLRAFFPFGVCRFYPSCSEYTKRSIRRYGIRPGITLGMRQFLHCHPF